LSYRKTLIASVGIGLKLAGARIRPQLCVKQQILRRINKW